MFITNNIIRRYTPPTCILEIQGKSSLLSRFKGNNLVRNLWFQLSFGDSKLSEEARVKICGDRFQLEALCEVVSEYVQKFLSQTPWEAKPITVTTTVNSTPESLIKPYLQQKSLLDHELYFSSIAGTKEGKIVKLTSTQLFDLANALDDFTRDIILLPVEKDTPLEAVSESRVEPTKKQLDRPKRTSKLPAWTPAAASFLFATSVTIAGMHFYYQYQSKTNNSVAIKPTIDNPNLTPTPTTEANRDNNVPPPPTTTTIPIPSVSLSPSLSNNSTPPPPPVTKETPTTNQQSRQNSNSVNNNGVVVNKYPTLPSTNQGTTNRNRQTDRNINSKTQPSANSSKIDSDNNVATTIVSDLPETKPIEPTTNETSDAITKNQTTDGNVFSGYTPNPSNTETVPNNPTTKIPLPNNPTTIVTLPSVSRAIEPSSKVNQATQIEQVQQYFQGRWQPPRELKEALQYNLSISNSGSLQNITPVGKMAATYLDRTNMPLLNESFISPSNGIGSIRVRLVLNPDGTVQTFIE